MSTATSGGLHYPIGSQSPLAAEALHLSATSKQRLDPALLDRPVSSLRGVGKSD